MSYNYYSSYPSASTYSKAASSSAGLDGIIAALGAFFVILLIFCIAAAILTLVRQWKMFKKAGKEGYIALIPVYNVIVEMQLGGMPIYWFFLNYCAFIPLVGWIAPLVLAFWKNIKLAQAFGKGAGTGVLLTFFPFVMYPVLGLGNAKYVGPQTQTRITVETVPTDNSNTDK